MKHELAVVHPVLPGLWMIWQQRAHPHAAGSVTPGDFLTSLLGPSCTAHTGGNRSWEKWRWEGNTFSSLRGTSHQLCRQLGPVTFYTETASSPHLTSLNTNRVDMNNVPFKQPTIVDASPLSDQHTFSLVIVLPDHRLETTPSRRWLVRRWWVRCWIHRLISGRGFYKGGTGRCDALRREESGFSAACEDTAEPTHDAVENKKNVEDLLLVLHSYREAKYDWIPAKV